MTSNKTDRRELRNKLWPINRLLLFGCLTILIFITGCHVSDTINENPSTIGLKPVVIDDRNIKGVHVTTRPHNRKIIYYGGYWFVFYGHGDKDADGRHRISWRSSQDGINWSERHTAFEGNSHSSSLDVLLTGDRITALISRPDFYREKAGVPELRAGKF